ncbi:MAG: LysR family transcriptional regulator, partial [Alphaproteobacteria bacterium]|nr:LysR family transcriptional regulator [Alphaproteobacteria bacterium]
MLESVTLDQLRMLIATVETGSFSAAGRRLGRVQSAVSQSVQALETQLGLALFDRSGKTPTLNEAGKTLIEDARRLVRGAHAMRLRAESMAQDVEPELALAVDSLFPSPVLMASLKALSEVFPHLPVTLFTEGLGGPEQRLRDGAARLAILTPFTAGTTDLEKIFLATVKLVPVAAPDHPLAGLAGPIAKEAA